MQKQVQTHTGLSAHGWLYCQKEARERGFYLHFDLTLWFFGWKKRNVKKQKNTWSYFMCKRLYSWVWKGWQSVWFTAALFSQCVYEVITLVILNGAAPDCTHQGALRKMCLIQQRHRDMTKWWKLSYHWRTWMVKAKFQIKWTTVLEKTRWAMQFNKKGNTSAEKNPFISIGHKRLAIVFCLNGH